MAENVVGDAVVRSKPWDLVTLFTALSVFAILPILWVNNFFATDVPAHLHSAHLFNSLLLGRGGLDVYALNENVVPNSLGHWMMSLLLQGFSLSVTSKVMAVVTWVCFAASVPWLRFSLRGADGLRTAILLGSVLSFNFLWMLGLYNFTLGAALSIFAIGLLYIWRGHLTALRIVILALLAVLVFFGHLIAFGMLLLGAASHLFTNTRGYGWKGIVKLGIAFAPAIGLLCKYQVTKSGDEINPKWLLVELGPTVHGLLNYLKQTDPFTVIGDHNVVPFVNGESPLFLIASPTLWLALGALVLLTATIRSRRKGSQGAGRGLWVLPAVVLLIALISPEDLGSTQGSILRQRLILFSAVFSAPLFVVPGARLWRYIMVSALGVAFLLQVAALWEYSLKYDGPIKEMLATEAVISPGDRIASVLVLQDDSKFHESGIKRVASLLGIVKNSVVWDNYETGYTFFPVVAQSPEDREFVRYYSAINTFRTRQQGARIDPEHLRMFEEALDLGEDRIETLIYMGDDAAVELAISDRFGGAPVYDSGGIKVYRRSQ